jgi:hypothetical protein
MTRYEQAIDVESLTAIDVHVHIEVDAHGHASLPDDLADAASAYFAADAPRPDLDGVAAYYRERQMAAVVFTVDAETHLGHPPLSSAEIAEGAARNNDVLIPFGSVDPNRPDAVDRARRLIEDSGVRGFKFHPTVQGFDPSDEAHYPLYEVLQSAGVVALFHTGQTGIGAGMPGGRGLRLGLSNPMLLDPVAADFGDYLDGIVERLRAQGVRAEVDHSDDRMQKKIRTHTTQKVPLQLIAGEQDRSGGTVSFRFRDGTQTNGIPVDEAVTRILDAIAQRTLVDTAADLA